VEGHFESFVGYYVSELSFSDQQGDVLGVEEEVSEACCFNLSEQRCAPIDCVRCLGYFLVDTSINACAFYNEVVECIGCTAMIGCEFIATCICCPVITRAIVNDDE
jgi:hypothetical protein